MNDNIIMARTIARSMNARNKLTTTSESIICWLKTIIYSYNKFVTVPNALKLKPNIALVEQKLLTFQQNLNLSPVVNHVAQSLDFCNVFRIIVCPLSFFFWPFYCLPLELRPLITPLISFNFSVTKIDSRYVELQLHDMREFLSVPPLVCFCFL